MSAVLYIKAVANFYDALYLGSAAGHNHGRRPGRKLIAKVYFICPYKAVSIQDGRFLRDIFRADNIFKRPVSFS
jgi:hypothetical protein